jgi:hypothetical protein
MGINPGPQTDARGSPAGEEREERTWRANIAGQRPAFAWAVTACLGAGLISAIPPERVFVRLVLPVGVMVTYVWLSYPRGASAVAGWATARVSQLADSAYFLGFLWTLWALIDSLVLKGQTGSETAFRVFGYALVTTFFGMAIRLYLLHFKYGPTEQADQVQFTVERSLQLFSDAMHHARQSIDGFRERADALRQEVEQVTNALRSLQKQFVDTHSDTASAINNNITAVVEEIRGTLKSPVQEYGRAIRAFTSNVNQQSQALSETARNSSDEVAGSFRQAAESAHKTIAEAAERIASDQLDLAERLRTQAVRVIEELRMLSERVASIEIPIAGLGRITDALSELERGLSALRELLGLEGQLQLNLSHFGQEVKTQTDVVGDALDRVASRLDCVEVPERVAVDVKKLRLSIDELRASIDSLLQKAGDRRWEDAPRTASEAILKLATSADSLRQRVNTLEASIKAPPHGRRRLLPAQSARAFAGFSVGED